MKEPEIPPNDAERVAMLVSYQVLDTEPEPAFDNLTKVAARLFDTPIALVSLVDGCRQWFKAKFGLDASETPRSISFCGHAVFNREPLIVRNATEDDRFADNPLVSGDLGIRFYAGVPLFVDGHALGTLCVIDQKPHEFSDDDISMLRTLGDEVVVRLIMRRQELDQTQALDNARQESIDLQRALKARDLVQKELAMSEELMRSIIDSANDGIVSINEHGTIVSVNSAVVDMFGYTEAELIGFNVKMLMCDPHHDQYLARYMETNEPRIIGAGSEVIARRKSGDTFPADLSVSEVIVDEGRLFTGILRDISERKDIERMKSEFISTVSHELRTPLTSIRGALGLVLGEGTETFSPRGLKMLQMAERNSERLTLLINDLLDLEKIESGRLNFVFERIDMVALAQSAIQEIEGFARECDVEITLQTSLENAYVRGDDHRLIQVLTNLISNACKFSPPRAQVKIIVEERNGLCRTSVKDHGAGIPDEFRERVFQRFAQADSSDSRDRGGTGLGLSICKTIVEAHLGSIDYTAEKGAGTTFFFDLARWGVPQRSQNRSQGTRVLICEDDPDVAEILSEMLAPEKVTCDIAGTVAQTRNMLARHTYSLLLLDLNLPDGNGLELLAAIRSTWATSDLPVIVVSATAEESRSQAKCRGVTVLDWIPKPINTSRLLDAAQSALRRSERPSVLHVEDDADTALVMMALMDDIASVTLAQSLAEARKQLEGQRFDLVLLDLELPDGFGAELLSDINSGVPVVIFSASEPDTDLQQRVSAALTKSAADNDELLSSILSALGQKRAADIDNADHTATS